MGLGRKLKKAIQKVEKSKKVIKKIATKVGKTAGSAVLGGLANVLNKTVVGSYLAAPLQSLSKDVKAGNLKESKHLFKSPTKYFQRASRMAAASALKNIGEVAKDMGAGAIVSTFTDSLANDIVAKNNKFSSIKKTVSNPGQLLKNMVIGSISIPYLDKVPGTENIQQALVKSALTGKNKIY